MERAAAFDRGLSMVLLVVLLSRVKTLVERDTSTQKLCGRPVTRPCYRPNLVGRPMKVGEQKALVLNIYDGSHHTAHTHTFVSEFRQLSNWAGSTSCDLASSSKLPPAAGPERSPITSSTDDLAMRKQ